MTQVTTIEQLEAEIRDWYANNTDGFKTKYDAAVAGVKPIPEGQDPSNVFDWTNATIDTLCDFLLEWFNWMPKVSTGLEYIQKFSWLYYENSAGLEFVTTDPGLMMTGQFVAIRGAFMDSSKSQPLVAEWITELGPKQMAQFQKTEPSDFATFNDFFIREIKDSARPVCEQNNNNIIVAPADCVINMIVDDLVLDSQIPVKTVSLSMKELLNNSPYAQRFVGGTAVSCILMPNTYHRYHSPVSGQVVESNDDVSGEYFGIKDFPDLLDKGDVGYGYDYSVFEHFRRGYLIIETPNYGLVGMVPVGLNTIASVVFQEPYKCISAVDNTTQPIKKGDEIGYFKYGGSLNILLFEPGRFPSMNLLQGEKIGVFNTSCTVAANVKWVNSGIRINATDTVEVRYNGGMWTANPSTGMTDANGNSAYIAKDGYTLPGKNEGALCGRIGENGNVFLVGKVATLPKGESGSLYLCINDDLDGRYGPGLSDNTGEVTVNVDITPATEN